MMPDPIAALVRAARTGGNPYGLMQQMAGRDPRATQAMEMMRGKSPHQLRTIVENMCHERGITPQELARQMGLAD